MQYYSIKLYRYATEYKKKDFVFKIKQDENFVKVEFLANAFDGKCPSSLVLHLRLQDFTVSFPIYALATILL